MEGESLMTKQEVFILLLACIFVVGGLVTLALCKGIDGVVFSSGVAAISAIAGFSVKSLIGCKKGKK